MMGVAEKSMHPGAGNCIIRVMKWFVACLTTVAVGFGLMVYHDISTLAGRLHGDEVHYLVITSSLLNEGDLDVRNNYGSDELRALGAHRVTPHLIYDAAGRSISSHEPGLPALLVLPYFLGGRFGVVMFLSLIAALAAVQVFYAAEHFGVAGWKAVLAVLMTAFNLPFVMISGKVFPDIAAALFLSLGFRWMLLDSRPSRVIGGSLSLALLPWIHIKFTVFTAAILLVYIITNLRSFRQCLRVVLPMAVSAAGFIWMQYALFGELFYIVRVKAGGFGNPVTGMTGLLFDREAGLIIFAPVFIPACLGLLFRWRRSRYLNIAAVIVILFWAISGSWIDWHSGHCPPARYLIPLFPFLGLFLALELNRPKSVRVLVLAVVLWSVSLVQVAGVLLTVPETAIVRTDGINRLWRYFLPLSLEYAAPSLLNPGPGTVWSLSGMIVGVAGMAVFLFFPATVRRLRWILALGVFAVSVTVTAVGISLERDYRRTLAGTPLPDRGPRLISPADGTAWWGQFPDLEWEPVPGAEGYLYVIEFPGGQRISVPKYGTTRVVFTEGIVEMLSQGTYCWYVVPLKEDMHGMASDKACFELF